MDDIDTRRLHHELHETLGVNVAVPDHDEDWWAWRRVDLAEELHEDVEPAAEDDTTEDDTEAEDGDSTAGGDDDDDDTSEVVIPNDASSLFQAPADPDDRD
jgi:hypothetical protein